MDLDGAADSPAPSPIVDKPLRGKDRGVSRSSLPPKETPIKQESAESNVIHGVEVNAKGKITFAMGAEVAFRPKATAGGEEPEWIQGVVVKIIGEGKSRRYDVQDPEPDEVTKKPGQVYRTSASSMVTIPPLGQPLADYPKGKAVLARYPDTTTFYRAEVVGMNGSMVNLRFEGEEDAQVIMEVDRRFVLDHRG
jgi:SAGA-associated factor 29